MGFPSSDILALVYQLLPGFLTAWIYFSFTSHPITPWFERVIQAMIFTALVKSIVVVFGYGLLFFGRTVFSMGEWSTELETSWSFVIAVILGFAFVFCANHNCFHSLLIDWGISNKNSYPSEWYSAFHRSKRFVILHFHDGRRLNGWPEEWPNANDKGHFVLMMPVWLTDDNKEIPLMLTERFVVPASDVRWVEFLISGSDLSESEKRRHRRAVKESIGLQARKDCSQVATLTENTDAECGTDE